MTLWAVAHQAPLSTGFSRQEHWNGLPCPPPGTLHAWIQILIIQWPSDHEDANSPCLSGLEEVDKLWLHTMPSADLVLHELPHAFLLCPQSLALL